MGSTRHPAAAHRCVFASLLVLLLAGCAAQPPAIDVANIDRVLALIQQRLGYMDDVARNKWNSGAPIEDLPREREIIDDLGRQAAGYGLDATIARDFFRAQIEASKIIQRTRFAEWRAQSRPPFKNMPDLRDTIRPALDALTPEMMKALAAALPALQTPGGAALVSARAAAIIRVIPADVSARDAAVAPLARLALPR
jgi:chorismate mutase